MNQTKNSDGAIGTLYVVSTPIGNLGDISQRAIETLNRVDVIAAEDTRRTKPLLTHFGIKTRQISYHAHNEAKEAKALLSRLLSGESVALVSDAGTPLISDPGEKVTSLLVSEGVKVVPVPGPCAAIAALSVAGLPTDRFLFLGFVPSSKTARSEWIRKLAKQPVTTVVYESPHRISATLAQLVDHLPEQRRIAVARELTKQYEECWTGTIGELGERLRADRIKTKGEFVLVLEGEEDYCDRQGTDPRRAQEDGVSEDEVLWLKALSEKLSKSEAAAIMSKRMGRAKQIYYKWLLEFDGP